MDIFRVFEKNLQKTILAHIYPLVEEDIEIYKTVLNYCFENYPLFFLKEKEIIDKLQSITKKYQAFNYIQKEDIEYNYVGGKVLFDILHTGSFWFNINSTYLKYNDVMDNDLKFIVKNFPDSLKFECIKLKNREYICNKNVNPIIIACINNYLPIDVIKFLLENKVDINIDRVKDYMNFSRHLNIKKLLKNHKKY